MDVSMYAFCFYLFLFSIGSGGGGALKFDVFLISLVAPFSMCSWESCCFDRILFLMISHFLLLVPLHLRAAV